MKLWLTLLMTGYAMCAAQALSLIFFDPAHQDTWVAVIFVAGTMFALLLASLRSIA